jgi:exopolysaccharide biosynthesis protein
LKKRAFLVVVILLIALYGCATNELINTTITQIATTIGETIETTFESIFETTAPSTNSSQETTTPTTQEPTTSPIISIYPKTYVSNSGTITIYKEWYENAWCYAAHLQFSDYTKFGTACANGRYNNGYETTSHAANRLGAIFTVNGCYSAPDLNYTVVRSGVLCNGDGRRCWSPGVYSRNTGLFLSAWESGGAPGISGENISELVDKGIVTDTFCFGPPHLQNGILSTSSDTSRAQRTFIGTNGNPGDIWIVVSDGRYNDGESSGLTYKQTGEYLISKGCTFGICLDGGGSSTMYFYGEVLNAAKYNERAVVDFVYYIG